MSRDCNELKLVQSEPLQLATRIPPFQFCTIIQKTDNARAKYSIEFGLQEYIREKHLFLESKVWNQSTAGHYKGKL